MNSMNDAERDRDGMFGLLPEQKPKRPKKKHDEVRQKIGKK